MSDDLEFNGYRYGSTAAMAQAKADYEDGLRTAFMAVPGSTEDDWKKQRESILAEARKAAALKGEDVARTANANRYAGNF